MTDDRIREIAAEFYTFLAADNDKIAKDPRRWHEELTSWPMEDLGNVVAALITKALNEDRAARPEVAPNMVLVPREPTEEMEEVGYLEACKHDYGDVVPGHEIAPAVYRAMVDAWLSPLVPREEKP